MPTILEQIVATKHDEIAAAKAEEPLARVRARADAAPAVRDFLGALRGRGEVRLIAEVKKASPSQGVIRADFNPVQIAQIYQCHGAACLSVLTDQRYFQGSLEYLAAIRAAVDLPILRKDFVLDPYQVVEARAAGADAVLLIAECLPGKLLEELYAAIRAEGMSPLVELYDPQNLPRVVALGSELIGINNRDLRTFEVDLGRSLRMRSEVPADRILVSESGIRTHDDVLRLQAAGVQAMLVGESLMRQADLGAAVDALLGRDRLEA